MTKIIKKALSKNLKYFLIEMDKKKIIQEYKKKIELIKKYNDNYYNHSSPLISDADFDKLKEEVLNLEKNFTFLDNSDSP